MVTPQRDRVRSPTLPDTTPSFADYPTEPPPLPRRLFLKAGIAGGALLSLGGVGLSLQRTVTRPLPAQRLQLLTETQYAVVAAVADRLMPRGGGFPSATELDVARGVDALLAEAHHAIQEQALLAIGTFESGLSAALFGEGYRPFTSLSPQAQDARLGAYRDSMLGMRRAIYSALRSLCIVAYFGDPRTWGPTGYAGAPAVAALRVAFGDNLVDYGPLRGQGH